MHKLYISTTPIPTCYRNTCCHVTTSLGQQPCILSRSETCNECHDLGFPYFAGHGQTAPGLMCSTIERTEAFKKEAALEQTLQHRAPRNLSNSTSGNWASLGDGAAPRLGAAGAPSSGICRVRQRGCLLMARCNGPCYRGETGCSKRMRAEGGAFTGTTRRARCTRCPCRAGSHTWGPRARSCRGSSGWRPGATRGTGLSIGLNLSLKSPTLGVRFQPMLSINRAVDQANLIWLVRAQRVH